MGGAGAGAGVLLVLVVFYGSAFLWLAAAVIAWILVMPRLAAISLAFALVSACLYLPMWYARPGSDLAYLAVWATAVLSLSALLAIVAILVFRAVSLFIAIVRRKRKDP